MKQDQGRQVTFCNQTAGQDRRRTPRHLLRAQRLWTDQVRQPPTGVYVFSILPAHSGKPSFKSTHKSAREIGETSEAAPRHPAVSLFFQRPPLLVSIWHAQSNAPERRDNRHASRRAPNLDAEAGSQRPAADVLYPADGVMRDGGGNCRPETAARSWRYLLLRRYASLRRSRLYTLIPGGVRAGCTLHRSEDLRRSVRHTYMAQQRAKRCLLHPSSTRHQPAPRTTFIARAPPVSCLSSAENPYHSNWPGPAGGC
jgi:hypothetical protein